jgi:hypothetical protein
MAGRKTTNTGAGKGLATGLPEPICNPSFIPKKRSSGITLARVLTRAQHSRVRLRLPRGHLSVLMRAEQPTENNLLGREGLDEKS